MSAREPWFAALEADRVRREHGIGKRCPEKPWMMATTFDYDRGCCGACGADLRAANSQSEPA